MYKSSGGYSSVLPTSSGTASPTFRTSHPVARVLKSKAVKTVALAYVGFCVLFTLKHIFTRQSMPTPIVYKHFDLERTYDPNAPYSVVSNLSTSAIVSKMFTYSTADITDNIQPFFVRSTSTPRPDEITLVAFVLQDELSELATLVERFPGPISAVLHIEHPSELPGASNPIKRLHAMRASNPKLRQQVDIHLITTPKTHRQAAILQQSNLHRNLARFFARSDYVLLMDYDGSFPATDVSKSFADHSDWMERLRAGNVFVLPGFNVSMVPVDEQQQQQQAAGVAGAALLTPALSQANLPAHKEALLDLLRDGQMVLSEKTWKKTIRNVDFHAWATTHKDRLSAIQNYDPYFSPSVVIRRDKMLWCPERFDNNHAACMFELYLSGADFWMLPEDFSVHGGTRRELESSAREKTINTRLNQKFHEEACLKHARAFYAAGEWDSDRARHCRISCQKVLAVWGLVIRQA
ncbi:hypothetical protein BGZ65_008308 [Modicella reniformis]|uniref:Glycosyltransferase family 49 protein n=1 Tax=Modicella reniformis TaxID=1440133 RepID=A0A9P6JGS4_9FUNG|nr:hypothetical protein BGZ65_008308 [Modicella reniformis]